METFFVCEPLVTLRLSKDPLRETPYQPSSKAQSLDSLSRPVPGLLLVGRYFTSYNNKEMHGNKNR